MSCKVSLDPSKDILSLYAPFVPYNKERVEHTRSVLLQPDPHHKDQFTIISSVTFALVLSIPKTVPIDYLLRYMLLSYNRQAYGMYSKQSDVLAHATICRRVKEDDEDAHYFTQYTRRVLSRIDQENQRDYEGVMKRGLLKAEDSEERPWRWQTAGNVTIDDEEYREMRNINFIREVKQVSLSISDDKAFKNDAQYRILFDNHLILYHFLKQFKHGNVTLEHKETKFECRVVLLDPVACAGGANKHERFEGSNYIYYVEKQLDKQQNPGFHSTLHFTESFPYTGGLLLPAIYDRTDSMYAHLPNTIEAMQANCLFEDNTGQRLSKRQESEGKRFRLSYNRFYVDLSANVHTHLLYYARKKLLTTQTNVKKKTLPTAVKKPMVIKLSKNQPTLQSVVEKIPEESKRKLSSITPLKSISTVKKPRIEQSSLNRFFSPPV